MSRRRLFVPDSLLQAYGDVHRRVRAARALKRRLDRPCPGKFGFCMYIHLQHISAANIEEPCVPMPLR